MRGCKQAGSDNWITILQGLCQAVHTIVRFLRETEPLGLKMSEINRDSKHVRAHAGASFATDADHIRQKGYIVCIYDKHENETILHFASYKSRRVAWSILCAETYAFADAHDYA